MLTYKKKINADMRAGYNIKAFGVKARIFGFKVRE